MSQLLCYFWKVHVCQSKLKLFESMTGLFNTVV